MKVEVNIDENLEDIFINIYSPEESDELKSILDKLSNSKSTLKGNIDEKVYLLNVSDIYTIYAENKKVYASTKDKIYRVNYRIYELEDILDKNKFVRISNSAIINLYKVRDFEATVSGMITINFKNDKKEYISRRYLKKVKALLNL